MNTLKRDYPDAWAQLIGNVSGLDFLIDDTAFHDGIDDLFKLENLVPSVTPKYASGIDAIVFFGAVYDLEGLAVYHTGPKDKRSQVWTLLIDFLFYKVQKDLDDLL